MEHNIGPDGSAIFFKTERFEIVKSGKEILKKEDGTESNSEVVWAFLKDKSNENMAAFIVTHLKSGKEEKHQRMRAVQTKHLIKVQFST